MDGWRIIAYKDGPRVRLMSRNGRDHTRRFASIAAAQVLQAGGFKRVRVLQGGWLEWVRANGPVVPRSKS